MDKVAFYLIFLSEFTKPERILFSSSTIFDVDSSTFELQSLIIDVILIL
jgi:hypothetical protein